MELCRPLVEDPVLKVLDGLVLLHLLLLPLHLGGEVLEAVILYVRTHSDLLHFIILLFRSSVADPWNFGMDPDPGIHAFDKWIRIRLLLFSSLTFKTHQKTTLKKVFLLITFEGTFLHHFSMKKSKKKSHETVGMKVFLTIFAWW